MQSSAAQRSRPGLRARHCTHTHTHRLPTRLAKQVLDWMDACARCQEIHVAAEAAVLGVGSEPVQALIREVGLTNLQVGAKALQPVLFSPFVVPLLCCWNDWDERWASAVSKLRAVCEAGQTAGGGASSGLYVVGVEPAASTPHGKRGRTSGRRCGQGCTGHSSDEAC